MPLNISIDIIGRSEAPNRRAIEEPKEGLTFYLLIYELYVSVECMCKMCPYGIFEIKKSLELGLDPHAVYYSISIRTFLDVNTQKLRTVCILQQSRSS